MSVDYTLPKPTAGSSRATSPTEAEIMADISDTIADVGSRLDALESGASTVLRSSALVGNSGAGAVNVGATLEWPVCSMPDSSSTDCTAIMPAIPDGWLTADLVVIWANNGATAGDVRLQPVYELEQIGGTIDSGATVASAVTATAGGQRVLVETTLASGIDVSGGGIMGVRLQRVGADAADTLAQSLLIVAFELRRATPLP